MSGPREYAEIISDFETHQNKLVGRLAPVYVNIGNVYHQNATTKRGLQTQSASPQVSEAIGDMVQDAIYYYEKAIKEDATCHQAHYNLGKLLCEKEMRNYEEARTHLEEAIRLTGQQEEVPNHYLGQLFQIYTALNQPGAARLVLILWKEKDREAQRLVTEGINFLDRGHHGDALEKFKDALLLKESGEVWKYIGQCHLKQKHEGDAIAAFENAIRIAPLDLEAYSALSEVSWRQEKYVDAIYMTEKCSQVAFGTDVSDRYKDVQTSRLHEYFAMVIGLLYRHLPDFVVWRLHNAEIEYAKRKRADGEMGDYRSVFHDLILAIELTFLDVVVESAIGILPEGEQRSVREVIWFYIGNNKKKHPTKQIRTRTPTGIRTP